MTDGVRPAPPSGIFGVFFILLGAGLILDGDWVWRGAGSIATGAYLLSRTRQSGRGAAA